MENFYLAYILNGLIGLAIGYIWGCYVGFKVGFNKGSQSAKNRLRELETTKTGKHLQTTENG